MCVLSIDLCLGLHTGCLIQGAVTEVTVRLHCVGGVAHTHTTLTYPISLGREQNAVKRNMQFEVAGEDTLREKESKEKEGQTDKETHITTSHTYCICVQ